MSVGRCYEGKMYGTIHLTFSSAKKIITKSGACERVDVICSSITALARWYLGYKLGNRVKIKLLDAEPYYLPAKYMCDSDYRNLRVDAIETVIEYTNTILLSLENDVLKQAEITNITDSNDILRKFFKHQLGEQFKNHIYLGFYLISQSLHHKHDVTLMLPNTWWSNDICHVFKETGLRIEFYRAEKILVSLNNIFQSLVQYLRKRVYLRPKTKNVNMHEVPTIDNCAETECKSRDETKSWNGPHVSAYVCDGLDINIRNNVGWAWCSNLPLDVFSFIWAVGTRKATGWERGLINKNVKITKTSSAISDNTFSRLMIKNKQVIIRLVERAFGLFKFTISEPSILLSEKKRWIAIQYILLLEKYFVWHKFFCENNIKVHVEIDYGLDTYARALSIRKLDGVVILDQRSQYYDNHDHTSDRPGDFAFVSGMHGMRYYSSPRFEVANILLTGLSIDGGNGVPREHVLVNIPTILVLDEPGVLYGVENVVLFINSMIEHCYSNKNYRLLFKPKKKSVLFDMLTNVVAVKLEELLEEGLCEIFPPEVAVSRACKDASLVVSVPSTAACITIGLNKPTIIYNPYKTIRTMLYEFGLEGKSIFEELDDVIQFVDEFLVNSLLKVPLHEKARKALDPWLDMAGNKRKGYFISTLIREYANGAIRPDAIKTAVTTYKKTYGNYSAGSWQEVWDGNYIQHPGLLQQPPSYINGILER